MKIKKILFFITKFFGFKISRINKYYDEDGLNTIHSDLFRINPKFKDAYKRGLKTLIQHQSNEKIKKSYLNWDEEFVPGTFGQWRTHIALWCAENALKIPGDFVECGVFVGFMSSSIMKYVNWNQQNKIFYLFDTFEGPKTEQFNDDEILNGRKTEVERIKQAGGYNYNYEMVKQNFNEWNNVKIIKGVLPESLKNCSIEKIAYLHIDMNCVLPEIEALRFFWPKMSKGSIILLDDYAFYGFNEQHNAMDNLSLELNFTIASLPTGQGLILKAN